MNLLDQDHSTLTTDQWTLLSNLIHSYDEHNGLAAAKEFAKELDSLHPKLRFKLDSKKVVEIVTTICQTTEAFLQSNQHFASLSSTDHSIVLHGAVDNVSCLGGTFLLRLSGLADHPAFQNGLEITYGLIPYQWSLKLVATLNEAADLIKLTLAIFAYSMFLLVVY